MTDRRQILRLGLGGFVAPAAVFAQPPQGKVARVGFLVSETLAGQTRRVEALRAGLADHGWVESRNLTILIRSAESDYDRLPRLAGELAGLAPDVIVVFGIKALTAASRATRTLPIVIPATSGDLVAMGLVRSLAHPGGNITGSTTFGSEVMVERLELLKELKPALGRVAVLVNPANAGSVPTLRQVEATARALNVTLAPYEARTPRDFDALFATMARARVDAIVFQDDTLFGEANVVPLAALATRHRLVGAGSQAFADAGGTIGYGRLDAELYRRGAYFVDRMLRGAKPGDLPIEQATRFELVINRKAAGAVGLNLPDRVLLRADRVVE